MAPYSPGVSHFGVRGRNQDCNKATNSKFNATSAANARMSAANRGAAKVSLWNGIRQRLEMFSLDFPKLGAIPVRPFATDPRCYSQAEHGKAQEALFEAEAEAEIASLERQLRDRQTAIVAAKGKSGVRRYFRQVKTESPIRKIIPDSSPQQKQSGQVKSRSPIREHKSDLGSRQENNRLIRKSLIRKHFSELGPLGRYVKDEQKLPFPVDMLERKMNADSAKNNAPKSQLDIWMYHKGEGENETRKTREPRRVATDRNSPIRFISDRKTEDAHIKVPSRLGSESSGMSIEQDAEPMEIRRYLSSGQTPELPSTVVRIVPASTGVRIQRVPGFYVSKHSVADKVSAGDIQKIKPDSPKNRARELHSKYSLRSLHDIPPSTDSRTS